MKRLWAPWRKSYVLGGKRQKGCFFCEDSRAPLKKDPLHLVLYRSQHSFVVLNRYPYTNGHVMLVPNRHVATMEKLNDRERLDILKLLDLSMELLRRSFHPEGFNVGMNLGRSGGAGIPGHVHLHVVPRWNGDTNFMPVLTGTKVISDSLESTYHRLRENLKSSFSRISKTGK